MPSVLIEGGGLAGQVLQRELTLRGVPSRMAERAAFPRDKVCGGVLQWDSWEYLNSVFELKIAFKTVPSVSHFWRGKRLSRIASKTPMVSVSRFELDDALNRQQRPLETESSEIIRVLASGVQDREGEWLGFQGTAEPVGELEMHYGRGIYLGIAPLADGRAHLAFIVKKNLFGGMDALRDYLKKELGLCVSGPLKGTKGIRYHAVGREGLAVGDAKLATHPFLGLGMKHAIESARLLAHLIAEGRTEDYAALHPKRFRRYRWASAFGGRLYDSPFRFTLKPILCEPVFSCAYRWLHAGGSTSSVETGVCP